MGVFVGLSVAAYTLPGAIGAIAFGRLLRARPARALVLSHTASGSTTILLAITTALTWQQKSRTHAAS